MIQEPALATPLLSPALSIDDLLRSFVGEFGPAQFLHFILVSLAWSLEALQTLVMVFADRTPSWTCTSSPNFAPFRHLPTSQSLQYQPCNSSSSICFLAKSSWDWVGGKSQSTVSEWGLLCGQDYKVGLVQSVFFVGALVGAGVFGSLSDTFLGRKGVLAVVCGLNATFGLLTALSPNYWIYFLLRGMTGFSCGGVGQSSFVLATEPVGPSKRGSVGMSTFYFFSSGIVLLCALAYFSPSWKYLYLITSIPAILYCLFVLPFISESPRWYLVKGRTDDALYVLKSLAKRNGRMIPVGISLETELTDSQIETQATVQNQGEGGEIDTSQVEKQISSGTLLDVFKMPATRINMVIMVFVWLDVALVYYGISLNVTNLGTNLYLSVFLNAIAEMPAFALTASLLHKFGRRALLLFTLLLTGACSIIGTFVSIGSENTSYGSEIRLACGVVAIFGLAGAYNLLYIYTAELFPTVVRNAALGLANQAAQIGAVVAPMVAVLGKMEPSLPFAIFSAASMLGSLVALKLPETLNQPMYETLEGMERREGLVTVQGS